MWCWLRGGLPVKKGDLSCPKSPMCYLVPLYMWYIRNASNIYGISIRYFMSSSTILIIVHGVSVVGS